MEILKYTIKRNFIILLLCLFLKISHPLHSEPATSLKGVPKTFATFTGRHLCWCLYLKKFVDQRTFNFIKKRFQHRCFPVNLAKFLKTTTSEVRLLWLLLNIIKKKLQRWCFPAKFAKFFRTPFFTE